MKKQIQPSELLKKVRKHELFAGEYHSVFKGQGMEFAEVREYYPGDDIRNIDWNVTARMNHPFVKQFTEERELSVVILYDGSMSMHFGSTGELKKNIAIELSALLAASALLNNDKVGLFIFTDQIEKSVPVRKGKKHIFRVIRELLAFEPEQKKTSLKAALEYLHRILRKRSTIFIVSDFWDSDFETPLKILARKHDLITIRINDPMESKIPRNQLFKFMDPETGKTYIIDTNDVKNWNFIHNQLNSHENWIAQLLKKNKIDQIVIYTNEDYILPLIKFFKTREKRIRA